MNLFSRIKAWFVDDVPPGLVACEFDCRRQNCMQGHWESCPNRLERAASETASRKDASDEKAVVSEAFKQD